MELASCSFGQSSKITPIQMITAFAATINGGNLMQPYVVSQVTDPDGNVVQHTEPTEVRQVISESKPMPLVASQAICWATVTSSDGARTKYVIAPTVEVTSTEAKVYTESSLNALTKAKILEIAAERGYEMTKTSDDTKSDIVTEFLSLQAAVNGEEE